MLTSMLKDILDVLNKQYCTHAAEIDALTIPTSGARLHNIDAEEVMGMFSAAISAAPNATIPYVSAKLRAKKKWCCQ
jgi:hypothetical protein